MATLIRPINVGLWATFLALIFVFLVPSVLAQEIKYEEVGAGDYGDFVVGPGKVELPLSPGETRVVEMTVTNRLGEPKVFNIEVEDAAGSNNLSQPIILLGDERGPYTLKDYISFPETSFVLEAGIRARIPVTITLPGDAEPGGRYGSVLVTTTSLPSDNRLSSEARPSSAIVTRIGTLFFVTTPGEVEVEGQLKEFTTIPNKKFFTKGPIDFATVFENKGSVHLNPYATISISNMLGEEVGFLEMDPWYAMPQSLRYREVTWEREFLFGRYTATVEINRGYNDLVDNSTISFWVIPVKLIIPAIGGLVLLLLLVRYMVTRFEFKRKES